MDENLSQIIHPGWLGVNDQEDYNEHELMHIDGSDHLKASSNVLLAKVGVLQYPSIWKAPILVLCSYPLKTPSPSFSSINPTTSLHSSLWFQPLASMPLLVCFFLELRLLVVPPSVSVRGGIF